jgi:hypothetical protein
MNDLEITLFTKVDGVLTKRISLTKDGKPHSDGSACRMATGHARRLRLAGRASRRYRGTEVKPGDRARRSA